MTATPRSAWPRLLLALVLALSAFLQATVVSRTRVDRPLRVDALDYFSYAVNLRDHGVYSLDRGWYEGHADAIPQPDAQRPPGYPLLLRLLDPQVSRQWLRRVGYVQSALGVLSVWLVFLLGRRFLTEPMALLAAALTALCPSLVVLGTYVLSESLFTFCLLAALLASAVALGRAGEWKPALAAGLLWGAASLVRSTTLFLPALFLLASVAAPALHPYRRAAAFCLLGFALTMSPWLLRNQALPPSAPGSSLMVKGLAHGSYPDFRFDGRPESEGFPYRFDPEGAERQQDLPGVLRYIARDFRDHPGRMLRWYLVSKPLVFLSWTGSQSWGLFLYPVLASPYLQPGLFQLSAILMQALHWPLVLMALAASAALLAGPRLRGIQTRNRDVATLLAFVLAYAIAFHMVVAPFPRYNLPFRPIVFLLAVLCLQWLGTAWRKRRLSPTLQTGSIGDK
jgi:4-amino-4-deoxy-L-arabinose transferase-like glycosyltransferase